MGADHAVTLSVASSDAMFDLGHQVAGLTRSGDLVALSGPLGAGKTTFTRGLAEGLKVKGRVTSPTFVLSRVHPSMNGGPALVHVDAYRLTDPADFDALDLDVWLPDAVVVVEWGGDVVNQLYPERLEIEIDRSAADLHGGGYAPTEHGVRLVTIRGVGDRWAGVGRKLRQPQPCAPSGS